MTAMVVVPRDETRHYVIGSEDGLTKQDLLYMRRRVKQLVRNLRKKYAFLGRALGDENGYQVRADLNLESRTVKIHFERIVENPDARNIINTAAILEASVALLKPRTREQLAAMGLEKDPDVPVRAVSLSGRIMRPGVRNMLPIEDLRIHTAPEAGTDIFDKLILNGFIYHPRGANYIPLFSDEPMEPIGRGLRRSMAKRPVHALSEDQRNYVRNTFGKFETNFYGRHGHVLESVVFDVDPFDHSFRMDFRVAAAFKGKGAADFSLQGDFDLYWRNKGGDGTALLLNVRGGLSRKFHERARMTEPMNIDGKKRAAASDALFNLIAMSGKLSVHDAGVSRERKKEIKFRRPSADERRYEHRVRRRVEDLYADSFLRQAPDALTREAEPADDLSPAPADAPVDAAALSHIFISAASISNDGSSWKKSPAPKNRKKATRSAWKKRKKAKPWKRHDGDARRARLENRFH
ncbi:MAG: hypothetical protein H6865_06200 [Rhodospirillales bacterium]|nr:hypothetical protein [Rhodospirillales bacterium]USO07925.1 MAG: hypothetical protein H6866_01500 [Rhodospirillales bacterium]